MTRAHVVGGGLAGLSAAISLTRAGFAVSLSELAPRAGGRCRSYHDDQLGLTIDNGNHIVLTGNDAVAGFLATTGGAGAMMPPEGGYSFADLRDNSRWRLRPNAGRIPWWVTSAERRVPRTSTGDYFGLARLVAGRSGACVGDAVPQTGMMWERLVEPFLLAALNTPVSTASAPLAAAVLRRTLLRGGKYWRARLPCRSVAEAFVDPAVAWLHRHGAAVHMNRPLRRIEFTDGRVSGLHFRDGIDAITDGEPVVLAVPSWTAKALVPGLTTPEVHHAIVNAHFAVAPPAGLPPILGIVGGTAQWIFAMPDRIAVTVSAADALVDADRALLAARLWQDVAMVCAPGEQLPPWRIVVEKRATFAATADQDARRPGTATRWRNLSLAGDWVQTGLPATIEGAIRSGNTAAQHAATQLGRP